MKWVVMAVLLAGCVPAPVVGSCGAEAMQELVGQDAAVLDTMRFAGQVRFLRPGEAVTMEYSEGRLNIEIDAAEVIVAVRCG